MLWHRDGFGFKCLDLFIPIRKLNEDNGPLFYQKKINTDQILSDLDLTQYKDNDIEVLSDGQKRRLSIARLFIHSAPIWLLDEVHVHLDSEWQVKLNHYIFLSTILLNPHNYPSGHPKADPQPRRDSKLPQPPTLRSQVHHGQKTIE